MVGYLLIWLALFVSLCEVTKQVIAGNSWERYGVFTPGGKSYALPLPMNTALAQANLFWNSKHRPRVSQQCAGQIENLPRQSGIVENRAIRMLCEGRRTILRLQGRRPPWQLLSVGLNCR
jgi:hypothetical protein